jgi:argininosuccinate lyase
MEQLIKLGTPMRSAHEAVGRLVREAIDAGKTLGELPAERFEALCPGHGPEIRATLGTRASVQAFQSEGSTAPKRVAEQLQRWKKRLNLS